MARNVLCSASAVAELAFSSTLVPKDDALYRAVRLQTTGTLGRRLDWTWFVVGLFVDSLGGGLMSPYPLNYPQISMKVMSCLAEVSSGALCGLFGRWTYVPLPIELPSNLHESPVLSASSQLQVSGGADDDSL